MCPFPFWQNQSLTIYLHMTLIKYDYLYYTEFAISAVCHSRSVSEGVIGWVGGGGHTNFILLN